MAETLAHHGLDFACIDRTYHNTCLGNPLAASHRVVVVAQTGIDGQP